MSLDAKKQINSEGQTILRIAHEFKEFLSQCPDEPETVSLLKDIDVLERVGRWLASVSPIEATEGIPAAGSAQGPSEPTCRESSI
jgi:hypothetical protein